MLKMTILTILLLTAACLAWTCHECGNVNLDSLDHCANCGAPKPEGMEVVEPTEETAVEAEYVGPRCPNCGKLIKEDWETCPYCGCILIERAIEPLGQVAFSPRIGLLTDFDLFCVSFGASLGLNTAEREYVVLLFDVAPYSEPHVTATFTELLIGYKHFFPSATTSVMSAGAYLGLLMANAKEVGVFSTEERMSAVFLISSRIGADFELSPMSFFELEFGLGYGIGEVSGLILGIVSSVVMTF